MVPAHPLFVVYDVSWFLTEWIWTLDEMSVLVMAQFRTLCIPKGYAVVHTTVYFDDRFVLVLFQDRFHLIERTYSASGSIR